MIKVAICGVGNCASALVQGVKYYSGLGNVRNSGVLFEHIGGYGISDITFVAAFDIDARKVGKPLGTAVFEPPNCAREFYSRNLLHGTGPIVQKWEVYDGASELMIDSPPELGFVIEDELEAVNMVELLRASETDVMVNYLPVGSTIATRKLAEACLEAGVPLLNCIPEFIASNPVWERSFIERGLPIIGDDMKGQMGASILSQALNELIVGRGAVIHSHIQENRGFNSDFRNMTTPSRIVSKKESKENVLKQSIGNKRAKVYAGPSNYIPLSTDKKVCIIDIELEGFGGAPITINCRMEVCDSENSAGVVIDAIRYLKVAREMGIVGSLRGPSAWTQKTPPTHLSIDEAYRECEALAGRKYTQLTREQKAS